MSAECSGCHAEILWGLSTQSGSRMPLDPEPVAVLMAGMQVVVGADRSPLPRQAAEEAACRRTGPALRTLTAADADSLNPMQVLVYQPHWATCPARSKFKQPPRRR